MPKSAHYIVISQLIEKIRQICKKYNHKNKTTAREVENFLCCIDYINSEFNDSVNEENFFRCLAVLKCIVDSHLTHIPIAQNKDGNNSHPIRWYTMTSKTARYCIEIRKMMADSIDSELEKHLGTEQKLEREISAQLETLSSIYLPLVAKKNTGHKNIAIPEHEALRLASIEKYEKYAPGAEGLERLGQLAATRVMLSHILKVDASLRKVDNSRYVAKCSLVGAGMGFIIGSPMTLLVGYLYGKATKEKPDYYEKELSSILEKLNLMLSKSILLLMKDLVPKKEEPKARVTA